MAYRDSDKRRQTERERQRRYRARRDGCDVTPKEVVTPSVTPDFVQGMASWVLLRGVGAKVGHGDQVVGPGLSRTSSDSGIGRAPHSTPKRVVMKNGLPCVVDA